jgi:hypothetical protein
MLGVFSKWLVRVNMVKVLMIMQHIILCTPCIASMLVSHTDIFTIDHVEQGHEEPSKLAPVEGSNTEQKQGKPRCIKPPSLSFFTFILKL